MLDSIRGWKRGQQLGEEHNSGGGGTAVKVYFLFPDEMTRTLSLWGKVCSAWCVQGPVRMSPFVLKSLRFSKVARVCKMDCMESDYRIMYYKRYFDRCVHILTKLGLKTIVGFKQDGYRRKKPFWVSTHAKGGPCAYCFFLMRRRAK